MRKGSLVEQPDDRRIREVYGSATSQPDLGALSIELGRARSSISARAKKLGLSNRAWPKREESAKKMRDTQRQQFRSGDRVPTPRPADYVFTEEARRKMSVATAKRNTGRIVSPSERKKHSENALRRLQEHPELSKSRSKTGRRDDLGGRYFRSAWEANVARWLNYCGVRWEYEVHTYWFEAIMRGTRSYTPDFFLPDENRYIEVKGWWDQKSVTRMARMKKYFPEVNIEIIDAERMRGLSATYGALISTWESGKSGGISRSARTPDKFVDPDPSGDALTKALDRDAAGLVALYGGRPISREKALQMIKDGRAH